MLGAAELQRPQACHRPTRPSIRPTVAFRTLGCKLNQCETAQMEEALPSAGYVVVPWEADRCLFAWSTPVP